MTVHHIYRHKVSWWVQTFDWHCTYSIKQCNSVMYNKWLHQIRKWLNEDNSDFLKLNYSLFFHGYKQDMRKWLWWLHAWFEQVRINLCVSFCILKKAFAILLRYHHVQRVLSEALCISDWLQKSICCRNYGKGLKYLEIYPKTIWFTADRSWL